MRQRPVVICDSALLHLLYQNRLRVLVADLDASQARHLLPLRRRPHYANRCRGEGLAVWPHRCLTRLQRTAPARLVSGR
jgi:hypothetical protein